MATFLFFIGSFSETYLTGTCAQPRLGMHLSHNPHWLRDTKSNKFSIVQTLYKRFLLEDKWGHSTTVCFPVKGQQQETPRGRVQPTHDEYSCKLHAFHLK